MSTFSTGLRLENRVDDNVVATLGCAIRNPASDSVAVLQVLIPFKYSIDGNNRVELLTDLPFATGNPENLVISLLNRNSFQ
jgi:hypothetical protein